MFLLGVGAAFPQGLLSNSDLSALGLDPGGNCGSSAERAGVSSRRISLPLDYIKSSGNADVLEGWRVATSSPTALGVEAVSAALRQSGIDIGSIGLLVADTGTPYQTCPSEAQRVAGHFGVKIPAYDIVAGTGAFPHFLSMFSSWKDDRLPDYVVCLSTNTPSQHVRYKDDGASAALFGDAAAACVISRKHRSSLKITRARLTSETRGKKSVVVEGSVALRSEELLSGQEIADCIDGELAALGASRAELVNKALFIPPQMYAGEAKQILKDRGVAEERAIVSGTENGFSLGSSYGVALASIWDEVRTGTPVVILHCGDGTRGSVVVEAC